MDQLQKAIAVGTESFQIVRFPGEKNNTSPKKQRTHKKKKTSRFTGVSFDRATGKWLAKSKTDPIFGKFHKKRFEDEEEAHKWVNQKNLELKERQRLTRDLDHAERLEAIEAIMELEEAGLYARGILKKATQEYIRRNPEANPTTVGELFIDWLHDKDEVGHCKPNTIATAKCHVQPFIGMHQHTPVAAISRSDCKAYIFEDGKKTAQHHRFRHLRDLFNYAVREGCLSPAPDTHPLWGIKKPTPHKIDEDDEYKIPWPIEDFEKLLHFSLLHEDEYQTTSYLLLGAYAGIRTSELLQLRFTSIRNRKTSGIDIEKGVVSIPASIAKTKAKRTFRMHPDLQIALKAIRDRPRTRPKKYCRRLPRPTDINSRIVSNTAARLKRFKSVLHLPKSKGGCELPVFQEGGRIKKDKKGKKFLSKPSAWIPNGLRTSFASYHDEMSEDKKLTARVMGHTNTLDIFDVHYRMLVEPGDGQRFFNLIRKVYADLGYNIR